MAQAFADIKQALSQTSSSPDAWVETGQGGLPSWFDVTGLAVASISAAMGELAAWRARGGAAGSVEIDRKLASLWFGMTIQPEGWDLPPVWDSIAGLYETKDGWIRLHTNAPHHRAAALTILDCAPDRETVADAVASWSGAALETEIVSAGGCAAELRSLADWAAHPQGQAVAKEPLIDWTRHAAGAAKDIPIDPDRPLAGLRVLDLTRVLAGPVATRFLAGWGADVLRIDPPGWGEANVEPEVTLGKRCATLNLKSTDGLDQIKRLLSKADILIHGYRSDALEALGFGEAVRREIKPDLIDVSLCAYGWTGPWAKRRGYDSLVQMSSGIAYAGMERSGSGKPTPLPVQALDHGTGYLLAAAALHGLRVRRETGEGTTAKLSLARVSRLLAGTLSDDHPPALPTGAPDMMPEREQTDWGPARRIAFPATLDGLKPHWPLPAGRLLRHPAAWPEP